MSDHKSAAVILSVATVTVYCLAEEILSVTIYTDSEFSVVSPVVPLTSTVYNVLRFKHTDKRKTNVYKCGIL